MKLNYLISLTTKLLTLILGVYSAAYLSRTLGPDTYGIYSLVTAITQFVVVVGIFGVFHYGPKIIPQQTTFKNRTFSEIFSFQLLTTFFVSILFIIMSLTIKDPLLQFMFLTQTIYIIGASLNCSWYFYATHKLDLVAWFTLPFQILNIILMTIFVNNEQSLYLAITFLAITTFLSALFTNIYVLRKIKFKFTTKNLFSHFKIRVSYFIPVVLVALYSVINKFCLGLWSTPDQIGIFSNAYWIVYCSTIIVTTTNAIIIPDISKNIANINYVRKKLRMTNNFALVVSTYIAFIIACFSTAIIMILFGPKYSDMIVTLTIMTPGIITISVCSAIYMQYLIPQGQTRYWTLSVILGIALNLFLSYLLIPNYGAAGAAIAITLSEILQLVILIYYFKDIYPIKKYSKMILIFTSFAFIVWSIFQFIPMPHNFIFIYLGCAFVFLTVAYIIFTLLVNSLLKEKFIPKINILKLGGK